MEARQAWRVEIWPREGHPDPVAEAARRALAERGLALPGALRSGRGFLLAGLPDRAAAETVTARLLADPVAEEAVIVAPGEVPPYGAATVLVRRRPGVADPEAATACRALGLLGLGDDVGVETYRLLHAPGTEAKALLPAARRALANPAIEEVLAGDRPLGLRPSPPPRRGGRREVPIRDLDEAGLVTLSRDRGLALTGAEMRVLQEHFRGLGRDPTDAELETFAQTWSEHCKHKTLTGPVRLRVLDAAGRLLRERLFGNLLGETVFAATRRLSPAWCWSVFRDNAGVVELTPELGVAVKVETHNHPSAIEPYGGAGTGIGGVIRDILGTGRGARPFAALDVFCVGPEGLPREELPPGTLHPDRILEGVVAGVRDYGNRMGIPTVAGTVLRHPGYVANPLVFCGCLGEIPRDCVTKEIRPGDCIIVLGGRTGRDGIHGATFSSEALHEESGSEDATAVQIGDPITEKKVLDVLLQARDRGLFRAVTDCGAGGFSSAVGEMAEDCGAEVELSRAPLKYPGLDYAEIWISEAQERMVLAVPPEHEEELLALCAAEEVEAVRLGEFTGTGRLVLRWHGEVVADLDLGFLHGGVPQPELAAQVVERDLPPTPWPDPPPPLEDLLRRALGHPSVASREAIVRQYDHEVQGGTILKPCQGPDGHGPGDGVVLRPRLDRPEGIALGCGIAPEVALLDAYAGAACAIDEAIRNVVAAGGDPHRVALLDNFCWGDCRKPDRLGSLARAAEACHDAALAYGAPFISGKDSLNNEYRVDGEERAIPPTLLCTAVAPLADAARATPAWLRKAGDLLLLLGVTGAAGGGSVAAGLLDLPSSRPPCPDLAGAPALLDGLHRLHEAGLVRACHDLSEGGLAVAAAEMVLGSRLGARLQVDRLPAEPGAGELPLLARLFAETPTRFLVEVPSAALDAVASLLRTLPWAAVGQVTAAPVLELRAGDRILLREDAAALRRAFRVPGIARKGGARP